MAAIKKYLKGPIRWSFSLPLAKADKTDAPEAKREQQPRWLDTTVLGEGAAHRGAWIILERMRALLLLLIFSGLCASAQQPSSDDGLLQSGLQAQQNGDSKTAIRDYTEVLKAHPDMAELRANLAVVLVHEGRFDDAIAQYRQALRTMPDNATIRKNLALAYFKEDDFKDARNEFEIVHKADPQNPQLAILLGDCELRMGQPADAVAMLMPLETANASNTDYEYVLGTALIATGKRSEGVARIEKVAQATSSADDYLLAGSTLLDLQQFARARTDLETALHLKPDLPRASILTGMADDMAGDAAAAEPLLREGLRHDPNDFNGNLYLGAILYKRRSMAEAKTYLDRAVQLQPANPTAGYEMAMWDSTSGNYEEAVKILEALVKSSPDWLQPHVELANVYYRLHRTADGAKERAIVATLNAKQQASGPPKIQQP
jgi:Flp pilus assembly protein TadD